MADWSNDADWSNESDWSSLGLLVEARLGRLDVQVLNQDPSPNALLGRLNAQVLSQNPSPSSLLGRLNAQILQSLTLELTGDQSIFVGPASEIETAPSVSTIFDLFIAITSVVESEEAQPILVDQEILTQSILVQAASELEVANGIMVFANQLVPVIFTEETESARIVNLAGAETSFVGWGIPI